MPDPSYGVLVPVKPPRTAKSRLAPVGDGARERLAGAFALDTITAALGSPRVAVLLAVTDDHLLAAALEEAGALVLPDGVSDDLNQTLVLAAAELARRFPELRPASLCADLPALRSVELTSALDRAVPDAMSFVSDTESIGTTLVVAPTQELFTPAYGGSSRGVHLRAGAVELPADDLPTLRRDVDTPADLEAARKLGVGPHTSFVLSSGTTPARHR
ncbi:MAG: 2-phospho-L-lactate guanylyltransferase [Nocardioidaceae bacterium]